MYIRLIFADYNKIIGAVKKITVIFNFRFYFLCFDHPN